MAALILASCQGMFLMTNDVRCDTILMSCVVSALWCIQEWSVTRRLGWLAGGAAWIALGMMTKGPIALMVPVFCFGTQWVLHRQWKNIFYPGHILALIVIAVLLVPMSIGLYQQFDMQPGKMVNGQTGVSGLRFFYWSQSFGRITGESPWNNGAGMDFLLLNMLWSFLPWIFIFMTGLITSIVQLVGNKLRPVAGQELVTMGGFVLAYLALGSSAYQLPHYIFVVFPLAAIITAQFIAAMMTGAVSPRFLKIIQPTHTVISFLLLLAVLLIITWVFPAGWWVVLLWVAGAAGWLWCALSHKFVGKVLWLPAIAIIIVNFFFTNFFYYPLLQYQVGSAVGHNATQWGIDVARLRVLDVDDPLNALHFYAGRQVPSADLPTQLSAGQYVLAGNTGIEKIMGGPFTVANINGQEQIVAVANTGTTPPLHVIHKGVFYKVSELTPDFMNPNTRAKAVKPYYVVQMPK
jgi:4-amino-4-deoxy-L-arabinose transferase-like glycosyltransferase